MPHARQGFSLIELVVAIGLVGTMITALAATITAFQLRQKANYRSIAYALAEEEMAAIKTLPFSSLENVNDADFVGVLYNLGKFSVVQNGASSSPPNIYQVTATSTALISGLTNLKTLPLNDGRDVVAEFKISFPPNPPSGFAGGLIFRATDINNYYQLTLESTGLHLKKTIAGVTTSLNSYAFTPIPDTWYAISLSADENAITASVNGSSMTPVTDSSLGIGKIALAAYQAFIPRFDDCSISIDGATTSFWTFDNEPINQDVSTFKKIGVYDLPEGKDELTISNYLDQNDIKQIKVKISWKERGVTRAIELTTLRRK